MTQPPPRQPGALPFRPLAGLAAAAAAAGCLALACSEGALNDINHMPVIRSVTFTPALVLSNGADVVLRAEAVDEDGDGLDYFWAAEDGALDTPFGEAVTWTTPAFGGDYRVTVSVSDGRTSTASSVVIHVTPNQFTGDIRVGSDPTGAQIVLNGVNTNFITPHTFTGLPVGFFAISLVVPDCSVPAFLVTNCLVFPATQTSLVGEDEDVLLNLAFVRQRFASPSFTGGVDVSPPQMDFAGGGIIWADNSLGEYHLVRNGAEEGPEDVAYLNLIGYDGDVHYPNWRATQRFYFQSSVADTGSKVYGTASLSGGLATQLGLSGDARHPAFSPSGLRFAFVKHVRSGSTYRTHLMEVPDFTQLPLRPDTLSSYENAAERVRLSTPRYSSAETMLLFSVTDAGGQSDLYVYELGPRVMHRLSTSGDRYWPTFSAGDRYVFWEDTDGEGVFGARFNQTTWSLGTPNQLAVAGSRTPAYGSPGTNPRVVVFTQSGMNVLERFNDN